MVYLTDLAFVANLMKVTSAQELLQDIHFTWRIFVKVSKAALKQNSSEAEQETILHMDAGHHDKLHKSCILFCDQSQRFHYLTILVGQLCIIIWLTGIACRLFDKFP